MKTIKKLELKGGKDIAVTASSNRWRLNTMDFIQGLILAIVTPAIVVAQQSLDSGVWTFDIKTIGMAAISGAIGYILLKLPQSGKILIEKSAVEVK